jgi:hypothetical protein
LERVGGAKNCEIREGLERHFGTSRAFRDGHFEPISVKVAKIAKFCVMYPDPLSGTLGGNCIACKHTDTPAMKRHFLQCNVQNGCNASAQAIQP